MSDVWLPGFDRRPILAGGPYDDRSTPKLGWHTWEGMSWSAAENAFERYPPHIACKPPHPGVAAHEVGRRQYVPLNRHAYAFAGSENDDEYVIQVEVAGFAEGSYQWTDQVCEWLAVNIVDPIADAVGVPPVVVPCGFHDTRTYRARSAGNYLASSRSEIRLTAAELRAFAGHCGHQHMPSPDSHWDPGALPIDRILSHTEANMPTLQEIEALLDRKLGTGSKPGQDPGEQTVIGRMLAAFKRVQGNLAALEREKHP